MIAGIETSALGNRFTGTSRYITCLLEQIQSLDDEVKTFSAFDDKTKFHLKKKGLQKFYYRNFILKKQMAEHKVDYTFFPDYFMPDNFTIPSVIIIHDLSFISHPQFYTKSFSAFYKYQLKRTLKNNPLILTISENSRNAINKYLGIKKEEIHLLQAYTALNEKAIYNNKNGNFLLYVGHIEPRKNLRFLISNFLRWKELNRSDLKLKLTGELWIKTSETTKLLNAFYDHPDIEFTGYVEETELSRLYKNATGFVHTSFVEGFCMPVLEAMHYKLPIICSSNTGAEEISSPYSFAINPYDDKSLIRGFDKLRDIIRAKGKADYDIKYSPQLMKDQLFKITDILKSKIKKKISVAIQPAVTKEEAIEKTLLYSNLFNSGIAKSILHKSILDAEISKEELENLLLKLFIENRVYFKDDIVYLNYTSSFYKKPSAKIAASKNKRVIKLLNLIPFVSSISFSGGTVHYGFEDHNDIDLFIIVKSNALYIVYAFIHFIALMFNVRKEFCANYLIDEREMEIKYSRDIYTANQIISLRSFKNENSLNWFFQNNDWIKYFYPNFSWSVSKEEYKLRKNLFLFPFNKLLKTFYRTLYRKPLNENQNGSSIKLEEFCIKLHTNDNREKIIREFFNAWEKYKTNKVEYSFAEHFQKKAAVQ